MRRIPYLALLVCIGFILAACAARSTERESMVYYPTAHVYVLEHYPGVYYHESYLGTYYRAGGEGWEKSGRPMGPWRPISSHRLPPGLRRKADESDDD